MIPALQYFKSTVAVVGLGKSGLSAARALKAGGAEVLAWDDNPDARAKAGAAGLRVVEPSKGAWAAARKVIWSPGIPHAFSRTHPAADLARALSIPLVCDVDLLCEAKQDPCFVAVTGTNGKSTTTALIGHILKAAGRPVAAGGNLGVPAMDLADLNFAGSYILELSSYQLELVPALRPHVAVWLNISEDHLPRHGGVQGYVEAKKRIFETPAHPFTAVIAVDDPHSARVFEDVARAALGDAVAVRIGEAVPKGVYAIDGRLFDATHGRAREICDLCGLPGLPGVHNQQNAACAYAAACALSVDVETIVAALKTFPGLAHRQQRVAEIEEVSFINDSKATNAHAAARALASYDNILWIAGGRAKEGGIESLAPWFPRIRRAFLIGEAAGDLEKTLTAHDVPCVISGDLETATVAADEIAEVGDTVLLSPACASWDQFDSFEHRGEAFVKIVRALAEEET